MATTKRLRNAFQRIIRQIGAVEGDRTPCGVPVSVPCAHALMFILERSRAEEIPRQCEIQRALVIDKSNVSRLVARMVEDRLVVEKDCPADGRARRVALTARGRRLARELEHSSLARFGSLLDSLPRGERRATVASLERLADAMEAAAKRVHEP